jgi:hypothetical protein
VLKFAHVLGGRVWAVVGVPLIGVVCICVLPDRASYLSIVAVVLIVLFYRFWRMGVRFDANGILIRGFLRTVRFGWPEVSHFADGRTTLTMGESSATVWAPVVVLHDGRAVTVDAPAWSGVPRPKVLAGITQVAAWYQIPAELTGVVPPPTGLNGGA